MVAQLKAERHLDHYDCRGSQTRALKQNKLTFLTRVDLRYRVLSLSMRLVALIRIMEIRRLTGFGEEV